jgi:hypothetical protein
MRALALRSYRDAKAFVLDQEWWVLLIAGLAALFLLSGLVYFLL